jgi:hypothetical protein
LPCGFVPSARFLLRIRLLRAETITAKFTPDNRHLT